MKSCSPACRNENFETFLSSLEKACKMLSKLSKDPADWRDVRLWICSVANAQNMVDIGGTIEDSPFAKALSSVLLLGVTLMLDSDIENGPLSRAWVFAALQHHCSWTQLLCWQCLYEIARTHERMLEVEARGRGFQLHICTAEGVLNMGQGSQQLVTQIAEKISSLSFKHAQASVESDLLMIQDYVKVQWDKGAQQNGYDYLDKCVKMRIYTGSNHSLCHHSGSEGAL